MKSWLWVLCSVVTAANAQDRVRPDLEQLWYPSLARHARIEGQVQFVINSGVVQLVSGHPLLIPIAKANVEKWANQAMDTQVWVTYDTCFDLIPRVTSKHGNSSGIASIGFFFGCFIGRFGER